MNLETEMNYYKQAIESEKKARNKGRPNLEEPSCSTPRNRERSSTPRGAQLNKSAITMRIRSNSPPPEVIDLDIASPPSRPDRAMAIEQQQEEQSEEDALLSETEGAQEQQNSSQSKRLRSLSENEKHNNLCANCSRTTE